MQRDIWLVTERNTIKKLEGEWRIMESIGIVGKCADVLVTHQVEQFLKNLDGFTLIYFTHSEDNKLYIVDSERLKRLTEEKNNDREY
jgi:hypothetical protein